MRVYMCVCVNLYMCVFVRLHVVASYACMFMGTYAYLVPLMQQHRSGLKTGGLWVQV